MLVISYILNKLSPIVNSLELWKFRNVAAMCIYSEILYCNVSKYLIIKNN